MHLVKSFQDTCFKYRYRSCRYGGNDPELLRAAAFSVHRQCCVPCALRNAMTIFIFRFQRRCEQHVAIRGEIRQHVSINDVRLTYDDVANDLDKVQL